MASLSTLLGEDLKFKDDFVKTKSFENDRRIVGLYFSAHWCPPCRGFTPELVNWYNKFKASSRADDMDIIFISSDRDESSFNEYYADMPWHSLAYDKRDVKNKVSKKFGVQGIPTLVFITAKTGRVITKNGREAVSKDPDGQGFPYTPKHLSEMMKGVVLTKGEPAELPPAVDGKYKALYFSAHWCPPCRQFTPELVKTYNKLQDDGIPFEVIFISWDRDHNSFEEYFGEMPWSALPYEDSRIEELNSHFQVNGIPSLILLDQENNVIRKDGRAAIMNDPEGNEFPWFPKPLNPINSSTAVAINEKACVLYFSGNKAEADPDLLEEIAANYVERQKESVNTELEMKELEFLYEDAEDKSREVVRSIKHFLDLSLETSPFVILLDVPGQEKHMALTNPTKQQIDEMVKKFERNQLEMEPLK